MELVDLQSHVSLNIPNTVEAVDLLRLAKIEKTKNKNAGEQLKLVIDGECCLDRLYGGYFPDWVCGGQWNKMEQFLRNFVTVVQSSNLDLVVFFNGALESDRMDNEWKRKQEETYKFIEEIQRHVTLKKKPPPKIWWVPPAFLHSAIRSTFRALQLRTMSTLEDHHKEIVRFCQKNSFHGVVADDPEYLILDIPRYFSARKLKLTFKGSLETTELKLLKVYEDLNIPKEKFYIFAALLGNHILSESDLNCFYTALNVDSSSKTSVIEKVGEFTKTLESIDTDNVVEQISKLTSELPPEKSKQLSEKIAKCLNYYSDLNVPKPGGMSQKEKRSKNSKSKKNDTKVQKQPETSTHLLESESSTSNSVDNIGILPSDSQKLEGDSSKIFSDTETEIPTVNGCGENGDATKTSLDKLLYRVNPEIENVCTTRHKNGLMSPYIYHILKHKEIKLAAIIESKDSKELPRAHDLFRPLRKNVYAILFNLHHLSFLAKQRNEKTPQIFIKETHYCPLSKSLKSEFIQATEIGWGVPTVERLWLGDKEECKSKRTRAFLAIMKSDKPVILDSNFVPQQMLVLACVLRYILSTEKKVLRKAELDAFIAQAFIQEMTDPGISQDIEVGNLTMRGIHLAHLFMHGVEMAMLTNDACGAPVPYMLFSPWMFFNGKVFNYVLEQQKQGKSLAEVCGYKMDLVFSIDQLRLAVTESVKVQYAIPPNPVPFLFGNNGSLTNQLISHPRMPFLPNQLNSHGSSSLTQLAAAAALTSNRNRMGPMQSPNPFLPTRNGPSVYGGIYGNYPGGAIQPEKVPIYRDSHLRYHLQHQIQNQNLQHQHQRVQNGGSGPGGQLEVAGMVVGSWGANYSQNPGFVSNGRVSRNPFVSNTRVDRNPLGPGIGYGQNLQLSFEHLRISGGGGGKFHGAQNNGWNQKNNYGAAGGRNQKKPSEFRKKSENAKSTNNTGKSGAANSSKTKGASFNEEPQRLETGGGDASTTLSATDKDKSHCGSTEEPNASSPTNQDQVNLNHEETEGQSTSYLLHDPKEASLDLSIY